MKYYLAYALIFASTMSLSAYMGEIIQGRVPTVSIP